MLILNILQQQKEEIFERIIRLVLNDLKSCSEENEEKFGKVCREIQFALFQYPVPDEFANEINELEVKQALLAKLVDIEKRLTGLSNERFISLTGMDPALKETKDFQKQLIGQIVKAVNKAAEAKRQVIESQRSLQSVLEEFESSHQIDFNL
mmetsp:Transcript_1900/g.3297  ORF Transcript_1900/g.3297 Transcript_1900/m.3297 type:complete len:152 (+) Transcript_1900:953-1408(+)